MLGQDLQGHYGKAQEPGQGLRPLREARAGRPYVIEEVKPLKVVHIKPSPPAPEPIYRFVGMFYPPKKHHSRFVGVAVADGSLKLSRHLCYWAGKGDYNVVMKVKEGRRALHRTFWVDNNKTHGEFVKARLCVLEP